MRSGSRYRMWLVFTVGFAAAGCGGSGGVRGRQENLTGIGPDGGVCTKDEQTIKNVMLAPPTCNATNPCPCGTFCSSQTGGNCVADCYDDSWCAPGYKCSGFGQCLAATDGGTADGSNPATTDPACPRDPALLDSLLTMKRPCQFDDQCPQGSSCNHTTEVCEAACRTDSQCASLNSPGHTFVCGCLGKCAEVAAPRTPPTITLPTLAISNAQFVFDRPTTITTPNWGDANTRTVAVTVVAPFITTGTAAADGGAPPIIGPTVTVQANPGAGLMVQCPGTTTPSAMPCTFAIDPKTFVKVRDVYRSAPLLLTLAPSTAAGFLTATSWDLRLDSVDVSNAPKVVNLRYADTTATATTPTLTAVSTPDPAFMGVGWVDLGTPNNQTLHIAVKARTWSDCIVTPCTQRLVFLDETRQLSPSGKLVLVVPPNPIEWQTLLDATGDSDPTLQDSVRGGIIQRISAYTINQDPSGNYFGSFDRIVFTDFPFSQPFTGAITSTFDPTLHATFRITKAPANIVASCTDNTQCAGGATCDLGFCSFTPAFHADPSNSALPRPAAYQIIHKRMTSWGAYYGDQIGGKGHMAVYLPNSSYYNMVYPNSNLGFSLQGPLGAVSGEPKATLAAIDLGPNIVPNLPPLAVPLITQHETFNLPASQFLRNCVSELTRDRTQPVGAGRGTSTDFELWDNWSYCINLGRTALALADKITFERTLQEWLTVHSFVMREGLEENRIKDSTCGDSQGAPDPNSPPPSLTQLLGIGESGLALLLDINANHSGTAFQAMAPAEIWTFADYRQTRIAQACSKDDDCNGGAGRQMACSANNCQLLTMNEVPQHDQPVGVPAFMLEAATSYLKVLEAYLTEATRQSYGQPADNNPASARQNALARYGLGMRLVLAIEQLAKGIKDKAGTCPATTSGWNNGNCTPVAQRYAAALGEMTVARRRVIEQGEALRVGANPLAIPEDDVPLFFGDPVGADSRYFAASDYLIDGWAGPAVSQAQSSLDAARNACISKMQATVQDELNTHARQQEIDQLMSKYGSPILAACGGIDVPSGSSTRQLESTEVIPYFANGTKTFAADTCFIDASCVGNNGPDGREGLRTALINALRDTSSDGWVKADNGAGRLGDLVVRSEVCKISGYPYLAPGNDKFQAQIVATCPKDLLTAQSSSFSNCTVFLQDDGNLYFSPFGLAAVPTLPVAALYGPIRKSDVGTMGFYKYASGPGAAVGTVAFGTGPDDNIYDYHDYRSDQQWAYIANPNYVLQSFPTVSEAFTGDVTNQCGNGKNGHLKQDYPLPDRAMLPLSCYRGELGVAFDEMRSNVLRLQRAKEVLDNGKKGMEDQLSLCSNIDKHARDLGQLQSNYNQMKHDYEVLSLFSGSASKGVGAGMQSGNPYVGIAVGIISLGFGAIGLAVDDEAARLQAMEKTFSAEEKSQECWNNFRAQRRAMVTAMTDIQIAAAELNAQAQRFKNLQSGIALDLQEGISVLQREQKSPVASLSHHFWLDEKVEKARKELEWARRLTFLALRATEYEFQQSLPFRSDIVAADTPVQLEDVVRGLKQEQASRTINRRRPEEASVVVSLRDDVLSIADRSGEPAGERNWTPAQRFASRLWDSSFAVRDSSGNYLGQGVPFTLGPIGVLETRCGERLWRATATIQGDGIEDSAPGAPVLLLKRNTFASQYCSGKAPLQTAPDGTIFTPKMQTGVIHTSAQLFAPGSDLDLSDANQFTAALLYPWFNIRRTDFYKTTYQDGASEELAGRGLYGDYVLLFPKQMLDDEFALDHVEDVLLRLDYLSVDNLSQ